jgi:hypothetical protein
MRPWRPLPLTSPATRGTTSSPAAAGNTAHDNFDDLEQAFAAIDEERYACQCLPLALTPACISQACPLLPRLSKAASDAATVAEAAAAGAAFAAFAVVECRAESFRASDVYRGLASKPAIAVLADAGLFLQDGGADPLCFNCGTTVPFAVLTMHASPVAEHQRIVQTAGGKCATTRNRKRARFNQDFVEY